MTTVSSFIDINVELIMVYFTILTNNQHLNLNYAAARVTFTGFSVKFELKTQYSVLRNICS